MPFLVRFVIYLSVLVVGVFVSMAVSHLDWPYSTSWLWFLSTFMIGGGLALVGKHCGRGGLFVAIPLSVLTAHALVVHLWPPEAKKNLFRAFHAVAQRDAAYGQLHELLTPASWQPVQVPSRFQRGTFELPRQLLVANGLHIEVYAAGLVGAHGLAVGPRGELYVSLSQVGQVVALVDGDGDGQLDELSVVAARLNHPSGLAVDQGQLYIATAQQVVRLDVSEKRDVQPGPVVFSRDLPTVSTDTAHALTVGRDGALYVSVAAGRQGDSPDWRQASVLRLDRDGNSQPFASGLHRTLGLAVHPLSGSLWASDDSPDTLGFAVNPDELNVLRQEGDYGWPFCYGERHPDATLGSPGICQATQPSLLALPAESVPAGLTFGHKINSSASFRSMLYLALKGSLQGQMSQGFRLLGVPLTASGRASGWGIDLVSGWSVDGVPWGQPQDVVVGSDGALYITDPLAGAVYRLSFPPSPASAGTADPS